MYKNNTANPQNLFTNKYVAIAPGKPVILSMFSRKILRSEDERSKIEKSSAPVEKKLM